MQRKLVQVIGPLFLFVSLIGVQPLIFQSTAAAQGTSSSLQKTLDWIKDNVNKDATFTYMDNHTHLQVTDTFRVSAIDGCRMEIYHSSSYRDLGSDYTEQRNSWMSFQLDDLDPSKVVVKEFPKEFTNDGHNPLSLVIPTIADKPRVKYRGKKGEGLQASIYINFSSTSGDTAERVGKAFVQAIAFCKKKEPF
jgi:hypothetical protein